MANNIYKQVENYVSELFEANPKPKLIFHSFEHTKNIVKRTEEIAAHYKLSENETLAVYIAAWFHDTGHLFTEPSKHEVVSCEIMRKFMTGKVDDEKIIGGVKNDVEELMSKFPLYPELS